MQDAVQLARRREIAAEGLLQHDAAALGAARAGEAADHEREGARRNGEIEGGMARRAERRSDRREGRVLGVIAAHVEQPLRELLEGSRVDASAVRLDALAGSRVDPPHVERLAADGHHGRIEASALHHRVERREDLLEGEIARRPEDHQRVGLRALHQLFAFSRWPPNPARSAESRRLPNCPAPRDAKRS
jgi:hypothetical protein